MAPSGPMAGWPPALAFTRGHNLRAHVVGKASSDVAPDTCSRSGECRPRLARAAPSQAGPPLSLNSLLLSPAQLMGKKAGNLVQKKKGNRLHALHQAEPVSQKVRNHPDRACTVPSPTRDSRAQPLEASEPCSDIIGLMSERDAGCREARVGAGSPLEATATTQGRTMGEWARLTTEKGWKVVRFCLWGEEATNEIWKWVC